jgi:tetrahydromethanopterin S-methyltransferase subunit G
LLKRQNGDYQKEFERVMEKLQDIEDMIEIIAREIHRQLEKADQ